MGNWTFRAIDTLERATRTRRAGAARLGTLLGNAADLQRIERMRNWLAKRLDRACRAADAERTARLIARAERVLAECS